jgi:hypothetical protein
MRYESGSLAECGQALNIRYPPFPYTYSPANAADSNKSVNEQYESSGSPRWPVQIPPLMASQTPPWGTARL